MRVVETCARRAEVTERGVGNVDEKAIFDRRRLLV